MRGDEPADTRPNRRDPLAADPRCFACPLAECNDESIRCPVYGPEIAAKNAARNANVSERARVRDYNRDYKRRQRAQAKEGAA